MIEEKIVISFEEYRAFFNGECTAFQCCKDAIDEAVNKFFSGATTVAHHGFNLRGEDFHAEVDASASDDDDDNIDFISLNITEACGVSAEFNFDATMKLVMTKTNNCVVIDCSKV